MPSVEYTKEKGLVQKSSTSATLDLRGELYGHRQNVRLLTTTDDVDPAEVQLTAADSGKELLIGAGITHVSLPAVKGNLTSVKFTAAGQFAEDEIFTFEGFGRKFKLKVVAENGAGNDNGVLVSTDADGVKTFKLERGAANKTDAITHLHALLSAGANDFSPLSGVTVQGVQADDSFQIDANAVGSSNNGVLVDKDDAALAAAGVIATNLTANVLPNQGQDAIADAAGLKIRLVASACTGVVVRILENVDIGNAIDEGSLAGTIIGAGVVEEITGKSFTVANAHDVAGDFYELLCDGETTPKWFVSGAIQSADAAAIT